MHRALFAALFAATVTLLPPAPLASRAAEAPQDAETARTPDCVYVGTPYDVIDAMLEMAPIERTDVVYDLGCGDGRIIVAAAKRFGCHGVGYDIDPQRIKEALENVRAAGVEKLVDIKQEDIFTLDLSRADVIMLYLLPEMNERLIPQLKKLKPGSRIVAHNYAIAGIAEKKSTTVKSLEDGVKHFLYLYKAPFKDEPEEQATDDE